MEYDVSKDFFLVAKLTDNSGRIEEIKKSGLNTDQAIQLLIAMQFDLINDRLYEICDRLNEIDKSIYQSVG